MNGSWKSFNQGLAAVAVAVAAAAGPRTLAAQRGTPADPLVKENVSGS
jgi:hypothetical protein